MCPSFSLWACRILKIRSCLRSPLAPGSSRERAMRVSSVMFFSFSSAMVMITYGSCTKGGKRKFRENFLKTCEGSWGKFAARARGGGCLSSPPLRLELFFCRTHYSIWVVSSTNAGQDVVHCFLNSGVGLVKLASGLRSHLTQEVTVLHRTESIINQIRAHDVNISFLF